MGCDQLPITLCPGNFRESAVQAVDITTYRGEFGLQLLSHGGIATMRESDFPRQRSGSHGQQLQEHPSLGEVGVFHPVGRSVVRFILCRPVLPAPWSSVDQE